MIDPLEHGGLVGLVMRMYARGLPADQRGDLEQSLWVRLVKAARDYRPDRGATFSTFAVVCLKREAWDFFRRWRMTWVRDYQRYKGAGGVPREGRFLRWQHTLSDMSWPYREGVSDPFAADDPDLTALQDGDEYAVKVAPLLAALPGRERRVVELRYGIGGVAMTLEEVGREIGVTKERVRQIEQRAMRRMRDAAKRVAAEAVPSAPPRPAAYWSPTLCRMVRSDQYPNPSVGSNVVRER